jgi:hypothetical protein
MFAAACRGSCPSRRSGRIAWLISHVVGPAANQNTWLLDDERAGQRSRRASTPMDAVTRVHVPDVGDGSGAAAERQRSGELPAGVHPRGRVRDERRTAGLIVMVSKETTKECNGNGPEPASGAHDGARLHAVIVVDDIEALACGGTAE